MPKKKEEMIPGKKYLGYGYINEFKEFYFEPQQTGSRAGVIKEICVTDGVHVKETKKLIMVQFNIEKDTTKQSYFIRLTSVVKIITKILRDYDI